MVKDQEADCALVYPSSQNQTRTMYILTRWRDKRNVVLHDEGRPNISSNGNQLRPLGQGGGWVLNARMQLKDPHEPMELDDPTTLGSRVGQIVRAEVREVGLEHA